MTFISLIALRNNNRGRLPMDGIIYRTRSKNKKTEKLNIEILVPRSISTKAGIDHGTQVDILYNPENKMMKLKLMTKTGGFGVLRSQSNNGKSNVPAKRVRIICTYHKESQLPITNGKNIIAKTYDINDGLNFKLEPNK